MNDKVIAAQIWCRNYVAWKVFSGKIGGAWRARHLETYMKEQIEAIIKARLSCIPVFQYFFSDHLHQKYIFEWWDCR